MAIRYAEPEDVAPLVKGGVTGWRLEMLEKVIENLSVRLSAWHPGLRNQWENAGEDSELRDFVQVLVAEAAKKAIENPNGFSSETMGPFAYSLFDSEDTAKALFRKEDREALDRMLRGLRNKRVGSIKPSGYMLPAYPMLGPGRYQKEFKW